MSSTDLRATTIHVKQNKYEFSRTISDHPDHTHTPQRRYDLQKCSLNKFSAKHHSKKYIFLQIHNSIYKHHENTNIWILLFRIRKSYWKKANKTNAHRWRPLRKNARYAYMDPCVLRIKNIYIYGLLSCVASNFNFKENWVAIDCWYEQWAPQA